MAAKRPQLSVVVPTKGRTAYLEGCLSALARVEYPRDEFEVLVSDDSGGEDVERLASSVDALAVTVVRPRGTGPSAARNAGAFAARGNAVAFTDDDCEPTPGWLAALDRALSANPGAAVGGMTRNGAPGNHGARATQAVVDALRDQYNRDPRAPRFFDSNNIAFPAEPLRALGGFPEGFRYAEDREMCERWLAAGHRFAAAADAVVHHMRTLTLREFLSQHYGYGRGAWAFSRGRADHGRDRAGVLRELAREVVRPRDGEPSLAVAGYVALSQVATAAGFAREAFAARSRARRTSISQTDGP